MSAVPVRIYLPLTSAGLQELVAEARVAAPLAAHAVTDALRQAWPEGDDEELEYAALAAAADASWHLRGVGDAPRRHVLAADVAADAVRPDGPGEDPTLVRVEHDVVWKNLAALHVDTSDHAPDDDQELAWFAVQEIRDLL
ncbi:DUF6912 family protein [Nocardioides sp. AE5]|uniref:DUF6912 family protein n=1 Tax=Nocardioides sp. AE5 TaxID=2962573 RepID=UPI0028816A27|nr:hypothetical protein [Nocardioides sp. AE5]MDT0201881.1 hypothetical protein [Nocardioides sp. AE5]